MIACMQLRNNKPLNLRARRIFIAAPRAYRVQLRCKAMSVCRVCGVDVEANKKNRRSLSSNDLCRTVLTDIILSCIQGMSRSHLDVRIDLRLCLCNLCEVCLVTSSIL